MNNVSGVLEFSSMPSLQMEVCQLLSESSHYKTYKARQGTKYVILKCPKYPDTIYLEMLKREYEIGYTLSHPCVVNILSFEVNTPVGTALVMEYIEGCTLDQYILNKPSSRQLRSICKDFLDGVEYLHRRGVIHNDLKPSNIIITNSGRAKIIDFGLSISEDSVYTGVRGGSEGFTAPEILNGDAPAEVSSDIYSVGKLLQFMSVAPSSVISKAINENPYGRYQSIDSLKASLTLRRRLPLFIICAVLIIACLLLFICRDNSERSENKTYASELMRMDQINNHLDSCYLDCMTRINADCIYESALSISGDYKLHLHMFTETLSYEEKLQIANKVHNQVASVDSLVFDLYQQYTVRFLSETE